MKMMGNDEKQQQSIFLIPGKYSLENGNPMQNVKINFNT